AFPDVGTVGRKAGQPVCRGAGFGTRFAVRGLTPPADQRRPRRGGTFAGGDVMRVICFLFLVLFAGACGLFAYQNRAHEVAVTVWDRTWLVDLPVMVAAEHEVGLLADAPARLAARLLDRRLDPDPVVVHQRPGHHHRLAGQRQPAGRGRLLVLRQLQPQLPELLDQLLPGRAVEVVVDELRPLGPEPLRPGQLLRLRGQDRVDARERLGQHLGHALADHVDA